MLYSVDEKYPVAAACPYICPLLSAASLLSHPPASFPPLARAHTHTHARARALTTTLISPWQSAPLDLIGPSV